MDKGTSNEFKLLSKGVFVVKFWLLKQKLYRDLADGAAAMAEWRKRKKKKRRGINGFENDMFVNNLD